VSPVSIDTDRPEIDCIYDGTQAALDPVTKCFDGHAECVRSVRQAHSFPVEDHEAIGRSLHSAAIQVFVE
jgi:hypothetical protein